MILDFVFTLVILIIIFGLLIFVHEFGHFLAAKLIKVEVEEFAFGFGKQLISWEHGDTIYRINLLPFGGYVKILGDEDPSSFIRKRPGKIDKAKRKIFEAQLKEIDAQKGSKISILRKIQSTDKLTSKQKKELRHYLYSYVIPRDPDNIDNKNFWQKIFVSVAGVSMNIFLAFVIFSIYLGLLHYKADLVYIADYPFIGADAQVVDKPVIAKVYNQNLIDRGFKTDKDHPGIILMSLNGEYIKNYDQFKSIWSAIQDKKVDVEYLSFNDSEIKHSNLILNTSGYDLNIEPSLANKIILASVQEDKPAGKAGLKSRDIILSLNNIPADFNNADEFVSFLEQNQDKEVEFKVLRENGEVKNILVHLQNKDNKDIILGASFSLNDAIIDKIYRLDYSNNKYLAGIYHTINIFGYSPVALFEIMKVSIETKDVELAAQSVSSIWGVGEELNTLVINRDYRNIINLSGVISVALAFMNILPIPLLDGGQVVFITLEKLRGKPLSEKTQGRIAQISFYFLVIFSIAVILKDIWIGALGSFIRSIL